MTLEISPVSFFYLLGSIQGLFIIGYLLIRRNQKSSISIFLSIILLGLCLTLYDYFILQNELYKTILPLILLSYPFQLAYGPLTYLLFKSIASPNWKIGKFSFFHFMPACIHLLYGLSTFHLQPSPRKILYLEQLIQQADVSQINLFYQLFHIFIAIQLVFYLFLSYRFIKKYKKPPESQNPISIQKVRKLFGALAGITLILLLFSLNLRYLFYAFSGLDMGFILLIALSLYLFYLAYFVVLNPEIFEASIQKYQSSTLADPQKQRIMTLLQKHIEDQRPYRDETLTIKQLAAQLSTSPRQLSQVINEGYGYNFYDYINQLRIEEAKKLLRSVEGQHLSVSGVGYEVGFNSKSSFYTAFKKFTKMTPGAYKKQHSTLKK